MARRKWTKKDTKLVGINPTLGRCWEHDKKLWETKKVARQYCSRQRTTHHTSVYLCETTGFWHTGGLPQSVLKGQRTRSEVFSNGGRREQ